MAIRNFFKKTPDSETDKRQCLRDPDQVLAWLEELSRLGTVVEVEGAEGDLVPVAAKVRLVAEETGSFSLAYKWKPAREPAAGQRTHITFPLDRQRFQADAAYLGRGNYLEYRFSLPAAVFHAERRDATRVKMRPRDDLNIIVLEDLFEGLGLSGTLIDLSMGGCCFLLQRAIRVRGEQRVPLATDLLAPGAPLALVRLPNLPHLPQVECGGRICSMRQGKDGVLVGLRFEGLGTFEEGILGRFLSERDPGIAFGFPHKRRQKDLRAEELQGPQPPEDPGSILPEPEPGPEENLPDQADAAAEFEATFQETLTDKDRLNRLRKRGKKLLLVMADELERISLMAMLHQDGYRSMFEAKSLIQALEHHRRLALDLLVVDQAIGHMGALSLVEVLREQGLPKSVPVVVLQKSIDFRLTLAVKAGKLNLLVERPVDFPGVLKQAMETMLGL